jgi:hypothetical protein
VSTAELEFARTVLQQLKISTHYAEHGDKRQMTYWSLEEWKKYLEHEEKTNQQRKSQKALTPIKLKDLI